MQVYALLYEAEEVFELTDHGAAPKGNFEDIVHRYQNDSFVTRVMSSVLAHNFFNVGDRDSMYNEMVNCGFRVFRLKYPQSTDETPESLAKRAEMQQRQILKREKKLKRILRKLEGMMDE